MAPGTSNAMPLPLLQTTDSGDVVVVLMWSALLIVLLLVGLGVAARVKRRMRQEDAPAPAMGFTLADLRQMHRSGQISDAEFTKAKDKIVEAAREEPERPPVAAAAPVDPNALDDRFSADAIRARRRAREGGAGHVPGSGFGVLPPDTGGSSPDPSSGFDGSSPDFGGSTDSGGDSSTS